MTERNRVAITGLGVRTPVGVGVAGLWDALQLARSTAARTTAFDPSGLPVDISCEVLDLDTSGYLSPKDAARADRATQLGFCAATDALADAGSPGGDPSRRAVVTGTCFGGISTQEQALLDHDERGHGRPRPLHVPMVMPNAAAALISMRHGMTGPSLCVSTTCASGAQAVGEAARLIRDGSADLVVAGGNEAPITPTIVLAFHRAGALAAWPGDPWEASRPFDRDRRGFVLAEGAAFLVLENWRHAVQRDARIYAELTGYGRTSDAHHLTAPHPEGSGAIAGMEQALADAGLTAGEITHVNAHGTSTLLNDLTEARALARVFGPRAVPVTATKSVTGHLIGASGAVEAVVAALTVHKGLAHPTANADMLDPECEIDLVSGESRKLPGGPVLSNSFGFGGHNVSLVLSPAYE
jgi:3-oxoacyl-[acyl-carrier-protein] synthase II